MPNLKKSQLEGLVHHYERVISEMQDHTFYCEDDEGALRRWYPPTVSNLGPLKADTPDDE